MTEFYIVALAHLLALISPGPDTIITIKNALISKKNGILTSLGIGFGNLVHIIASLMGLGLIISQSVVIYSIIKYICGAYLIYLGIKSIKSRTKFNINQEVNSAIAQKEKSSIFEGALNSILNPKVTLFYFALFSQVISADTQLSNKFLYSLYLFIVTSAYFSILSLCLNIKPVKALLNKAFGFIEKFTGALLVFLGLKVIAEK